MKKNNECGSLQLMKSNLKASKKMMLFFTAIFLVFPCMVFAASGIGLQSFGIPLGDLSVAFLSRIFGTVGGVLLGPPTIFGQIFYVFNWGILMIAGTVLTYTTFRAVVEIAHADPGQMGKKFTWWIPVRVVMGVSLLVPQATGYSMLNALVMWITLQGVGLADTIWSQAIDYMQKGGVLYTSPKATPTGVIPDAAQQVDGKLVDKFKVGAEFGDGVGVASILRSQICMQALYKHLVNEQNAKIKEKKDLRDEYLRRSQEDSIPEVERSGVLKKMNEALEKISAPIPSYSAICPNGSIAFPCSADPEQSKLNGVCGRYYWQPVVPAEKNPEKHEQDKKNYADAKKEGLLQVILGLEQLARRVVDRDDDYFDVFLAGDPNKPDIDSAFTTRAYEALVAQAAGYQAAIYTMRSFAGNGYENVAISSVLGQDMSDTSDTMKKNGWILAGSYYFYLVDAKNTFKNIDQKTYMFYALSEPPYCDNETSCKNLPDSVFASGDSSKPNDLLSLKKRLAWVGSTEGKTAIGNSAYALVNKLNSAVTDSDMAMVDLPGELRLFASERQVNLGVSMGGDPSMPLWKGLGGGSLLEFFFGKNALTTEDGFMGGTEGPLAFFYYIKNLVNSATGAFNEDYYRGRIQASYDGNFEPINEALRNIFCLWSFELGVFPLNRTVGRGCDYSSYEYGLVQGRPPIVKLQMLGEKMVVETVAAWNKIIGNLVNMTMSIVRFNLYAGGVSVVMAAASFAGAGLGTSAVAQFIATSIQTVIKLTMEIPLYTSLPIVGAISSILLTIGVTLAYYIPLLPFMLFLFGAVGWLAFVIEAMVAAPIIALGMTHPEGHDMLGKSEQGIMMLLSVFIRPAAMLIGLISGIMLSYVVIDILNSGFGMVIGSIFYKNGGTQGAMFQIKNMAMIFIYVLVAMSVIQQCFSLIHIIPNKIMHWIGVGGEAGMDQQVSQMTEGVKGQMTGAADKMSGAYGQAAGGMKAELGMNTGHAQEKPEKDKGKTPSVEIENKQK